MGQIRIELQNISKSYYAESSVTQALRKVSLMLSQGEFVAITGESGSGKSTLLHIIGGLDNFDDGEMFIDGRPTFPFTDEDWEDYRRNEIGYIFQDYSLVGHYTALDNVTSALLIMGNDKQTAKKRTLFYLEQVGLKGYEHHPASELSSGQKQRLSIARALAKNTGIIVADEPTGNLDSDTGTQIMELLHQLSKDYLVVMVTHNYTQAEPYITRRIHIHDGVIVSDTSVEHKATDDSDAFVEHKAAADSDTAIEEDLITTNVAAIPSDTAKLSSHRKTSRSTPRFLTYLRAAAPFSWMNLKSQRGRAILFTIFLFLVSSVSFLLIGELHLHGDDIFTKTYVKDAFAREDSMRLVAKHTDGSAITAQDLKSLCDVPYVETTDSCDLASDVNFYLEKDRDYTYIYGKSFRSSKGSTSVSFLNEDHFVSSSDRITESDLQAGTLPQKQTDVVLYSSDKNIFGTELTCYFSAANIWGADQYITTTLTVCGLLKEETEQAYFAKDMCQMLSLHVDSGTYRICYDYDYTKNDYEQKPALIPVINDSLTGNQVRISQKLDGPTGTTLFRYTAPSASNSDPQIIEEDVEILEERHDFTSDFIEVSPKFYARYYNASSTQVSVYIASYAKTDSVILHLNRLGYTAISTYRMSAMDYDVELVNQRLVIIGISVFGLLVLLLGEVLILKALMKIRIKDYFVLKFIGMKMPVLSAISYLEMLLYCLFAMVLTVVIALILWACQIPVLSELMWYYDPAAYLLYALYNLLLVSLTVNRFNHIMKGRLSL